MTPRAPLPVVFSHIPKTAGSTTYGLLVRNYGSGLYPAYGPHREMIKEGLTQARPGGPITCIAGHQPLGTYSSEFRRLVIFRDPVARLRSMHAYLRRQKGYENDETWEAATNYPLSEYTAADPLSTWNAQVRFDAGRNDPVASDDTGAPADKTRRIVGKYIVFAPGEPAGVAAPRPTRLISAGEPNKFVTPNSRAGSRISRGSTFAGRVKSIRGMIDVIPSAGANNANKGNVHRSISPGSIPKMFAMLQRSATAWPPLSRTTPLGFPVVPEV